MKRDTKKFLELMERQNRTIAEREAAKGPTPPEPGVDPIREERERERREKYGTFRAEPRFRAKRTNPTTE